MSSIDSEYVYPELGASTTHKNAIINGAPIPGFTMATAVNKRVIYFTRLEREVLIQAHVEYEAVFSRRGNAAAAAKEGEASWEETEAQVNARRMMTVRRHCLLPQTDPEADGGPRQDTVDICGVMDRDGTLWIYVESWTKTGHCGHLGYTTFGMM